ncbi:hypothetical protein E4U64_28905 (plasmid) [Escherichia coli O157:H7]|nr:hypothetical protein E4U64_28905 [Escherichia coli O157:H7]
MLPSETMIWQPEFTDKTLSRKPGAVHSVQRAISGYPSSSTRTNQKTSFLFLTSTKKGIFRSAQHSTASSVAAWNPLVFFVCSIYPSNRYILLHQ